MLTPWIFIPLVALCCNVGIIIAAVTIDARHPANRFLVVLCCALTWWAAINLVDHTVRDPALFVAAVRLSAPVWVLITPMALHLVLVVVRERPLIRDYPAYFAVYGVGAVFIVLHWTTELLYTNMPVLRPWGYHTVPGPWFPLLAAYSLLFSLAAMGVVIRRTLRTPSGRERRRMYCFAGGILVPVLGGVTTNLVGPFLGVSTFYYSALGLTTVSAALFALGMFRYRLLRPSLGHSARQVLRCMSQPVLLVGPDRRIVEANAAAEALVEYASNGLVGVPIADILAGGAKEWDALLSRRDGENQLTNVDTSWKTAGGAVAPVLASLTTLRGAHGECEGYLLLGTDYREVKRAQQALRESEELYRTLYESSVLGVVLGWDVIHQANEQAAAILGTTVGGLLGHRPEEFWPETQPDGRPSPEVAREKREAALAGQPQFFVWRYRRPDGSLVDCAMSMNAVTLKGRRLLQMTMRDVTEERLLEEAVQHLHEATSNVVGEAFFQALTGHVAQWLGTEWAQIAEIRPDDPDSGHALAVCQDGRPDEPYCYTLAGSPCEEVVQKGGAYYASGVAAQFPDDSMLVELGVESYAGLPLQDPEGNTIGLLCAFGRSPLHLPWDFVEAIFRLFAARASAELTRLRAEQHEREHAEQLRELQKMESVALLAGGVAHDFNNILVGVLGHATLAREALPADSPAQRSLAVIEDSAERAVGLTAQLLAYARGGKQNSVAVDMRGLVTDLLDMLEAVLPKAVTVQCLLPEGVPPILADPSQMQQVVMNLCTNAGEAMGETGGTLRVQLGLTEGPHCLAGPAAVAATYVVLTVTDTGCGMDADTVRHIFEPFFTTKDFGRGLGLAAAQGIVVNHGGCLHCESAPGRGTTFALYLPAHDTPIPVPADPPEALPAANGAETILVAEDEEVVRQFVSDVLRDLGYHVIPAASGDEAIAVYHERAGDIDLVLLDLIMPGRNGLETLAELRRVNPAVKAVLTSGYTEAHLDRTHTKPAGAAFLQKPYRPRALADTVRHALSA